MTVDRSPTLHKSKSKIRLAFGLGEARPSPPRTVPPPMPARPTSNLATPTLPVTASSSTLHSYGTRTTVEPAFELNSSTSTNASNMSRPDSRSLFRYDNISPSTQDHTLGTSDAMGITQAHSRPRDLAFDTVSYASASPRSTNYFEQSFANAVPAGSTSSSLTASDVYSYDEEQYAPRDPLDGYPHPKAAIEGSDDIFACSDEHFNTRFELIKEIGSGNWGSVWKARPLHVNSSRADMRQVRRLGRASALSQGSRAGGMVAIKLVKQDRSDPCTPARVQALWGEMKVIHSLKREPHPSIIQFEALLSTPSYVLVIMPLLVDVIQVQMDLEINRAYMRQLASAVAYLHERGVTHNDIKPANIMISHSGCPVLIDFGFAHVFDLSHRDAFWTQTSWGTPEYLDPLRADGAWHDERAADVWSLGVTFFELLMARTPFEFHKDDICNTEEEFRSYKERSKRGIWLGDWDIPDDLVHLIHQMLRLNPTKRYTAMEAYHHPALRLAAPDVIITPRFVRAAAAFDEPEPLPAPMPAPLPARIEAEIQAQALAQAEAQGHVQVERVKGKSKKKRDTAVNGGRSTPLPLGESIKQHTANKGGEVPSPKKGSKLVIKKMRSVEGLAADEEDPTPTKILKPGQPLRMDQPKEEKKIALRASHKNLRLARTESMASLAAAANRDSVLTTRALENANVSARSSIVVSKQDKNKENVHPLRTSSLQKRASQRSLTGAVKGEKTDAVLKTMRSLQGIKAKRDILSAIKRPAPEPPRPDSVVSVQSTSSAGDHAKDKRKSMGIDKSLADLEEVAEEKTPEKKGRVLSGKHDPMPKTAPVSPPRHELVRTLSKNMSPASFGSPPRKRLAKPAMPIPDEEGDTSIQMPGGPPRLAYPSGMAKGVSPLRDLKDRIMSTDEANLDRFRQSTDDLGKPIAKVVADPALQHRKSVEALAIDSRLDQLSEWVKSVEAIVQEARKALAEGRELPLPALNLPALQGMSAATAAAVVAEAASAAASPAHVANASGRQHGVSPSHALPAHLRTESTQVEAGTPPKWMTYAEAEERVRLANEMMEAEGGAKRSSLRKERGSVSSVLKMSSQEKDKKEDRKAEYRASTPEPNMHIPLKPPAPVLRATPSTPMLRTSISGTQTARVVTRKSESNLRALNTLPTNVAFAEAFRDPTSGDYEDGDHGLGPDGVAAPNRRLYERFLDTTPGVVRQGDGWGSLSSGKALHKPSSMLSLREKARAFLGGAGDRDSRQVADFANQTIDNGEAARRTSKQLFGSQAERQGDRSQRPQTPGGMSVLSSSTGAPQPQGQKGWGIFKRMGRKGKKTTNEEA